MTHQKNLALYSDTERELWEQVEEVIEGEYGSDAREGEVAAQAFAAYLGTDGPLDGNECPICGEQAETVPYHIRDAHGEEASNA
jgi:hypothetical protein